MAIKRKDCHPPKSDGQPLWGANTPQYVHYEALGYFVRGGGIATPEAWRTQNGGLQIPDSTAAQRCVIFSSPKLASKLALVHTKNPQPLSLFGICAGEGTSRIATLSG